MFNFLIKLLDFIYKKKCYFCRKSFENTIMCRKCFDNIELFDDRPVKEIFDVQVYACCFYAKEMQKLIRGVKYHGRKDLAPFQAKIMWQYFSNLVELNEDFVIVPVPLHKKRYKQRKYNHMELVAQELSKLSGWCVKTDLIERIKETKPQYKLKILEREENLKNAFKINPQNYHGENLLLIDDIFTTGSTFREIIKTFQRNNIFKITALATSAVHGNSTLQK